MTDHQPQRSKWVLVTTAVVGGLLLLAVVGTGAAQALMWTGVGSDRSTTKTADALGVQELDLEAGSAEVTVVFDGAGGADTALLSVEGGMREWTLERDDSTLELRPKRGPALGWLGFGSVSAQRVTLHLPSSFERQGLDLDLDVSSGSIVVPEAVLGDVEVRVSSGSAEVHGTALSFDGSVSSGRLGFELEDVRELDLNLSSGVIRGELSGSAPLEVEVGVSSGRAELRLPDVAYAVSTRVSSGDLDNQLRTDPASRYTVDARVSSGSLRLSSGR